MYNIQVVPDTSEGCGLCQIMGGLCLYHEDGRSLIILLRGPRIKFTRKQRVTADGQDVGRWEKRGDKHWEAHLDDGSSFVNGRFGGLRWEILKFLYERRVAEEREAELAGSAT